MIRPILTIDDARLRAVARPVAAITATERALAVDLVDTMLAADGLGLAAPQIGVLVRAIAVEREHETPLVLFNPEVVTSTGEALDYEGCLSIPGLVAEVRRATAVTYRGLGVDGAPLTITATGRLARALQHELDHLEGVVFLDHLARAERRRLWRAWRTRDGAESTLGAGCAELV